jgi:hypothetical protein
MQMPLRISSRAFDNKRSNYITYTERSGQKKNNKHQHMKKIILSGLLTVLVGNFLNAQFTVNKIDGTPFVNNEIIEFTTSNTAAAELKFIINNTGTENLDFRIRCMDLVNNTGSNFQLCFGFDCFASVASNVIYPDYQVIVNAGQNRQGFGDNFKNFNPGDGVNFPMDYSFRFFTRNLAGAIVGSNLNITYRYQGPLSIDQRDKLSLMGVKVLNNVVNEFIGLEIQKSTNYYLVNMQGQRISEGVLNGNATINLSHLQAGIYLLNFSNEFGLSDTVKIVKK